MMTQIAIDSLPVAQRELEQYIEAQANAIAPEAPGSEFDTLAQATENILAYAMWLAQQKENLSKKEYKKLLRQHGWKTEDTKYLKVAAAFKLFAHKDLSQIEPATLFRLANNPKKYQSAIDELLNVPDITQETVRDLIAKQRPPKEPKQEKPSIWRRTPDGRRYCQVPPIHEENEQTGITLQQMMDSEGLTAQRIVAEAIALRQAYIEGHLVLVQPQQETSTDSEQDATSGVQQPDVSQETDSDAMGFAQAIARSAVEEPIVQSISLIPSANFLNEQTIPNPTHDSEVISLEISKQAIDPLYKAAQIATAQDVKFEDNREDNEPVVGAWTFEPEPEKDDWEDDTKDVPPVLLLIETFQKASSWQEISRALNNYEQYKQLAWDALTPNQKQRITALIPTEVKKLSEAKKAGKIIDFREVREDVYQVQHHGHVFWEVVSASRLDSFLAQL